MTVVQETAPFGIVASRELGERLGDWPALAALRSEGAAAASVKGWPDRYRERPWKYHDATETNLDAYTPALDAVHPSGETLRSCPVSGEHAAALLQENSQTVFTEPAPAGLVLAPFEQVTDARLRERIARHLGEVVPAVRSRFTALHYAFLREGVVVHVDDNAEFHEPVRIVRNYVSAGQFAAPHTLIVTGANSRVTVVEEFHSGEGDILVTPVVEIVPGPGATVRHVTVHRWGPDTKVYSEQRMVPERDSALVDLHLVTGGRVVKNHIESSLAARGSSSEIYGLTFGRDHQHIDLYTVQDHIGPDTRSDLLVKSALTDEARAVYYGLTRVGLEAKNADANQENRNLLLSDTAKADSDPVLEILTSDVIRVSHGVTAGPVDDEQLYYLQTRGIPHAAAEALLVRAFLHEVLARLGDDALRGELESVLEAALA